MSSSAYGAVMCGLCVASISSYCQPSSAFARAANWPNVSYSLTFKQ